MSQIPRTFAFDKNIQQDQYEQYIDPEDLLNESFEKVKGDFEFYRKKKGRDIVREEQAERDLNSRQKKPKTVPEVYVRPKVKLPQNQVISEMDPVNIIVTKTREKIRFLEFKCDKLKKRVQQPEFAKDHKSSKNSIQKTNLEKEQIFNENDFAKLIQNEEENTQKDNRENPKKQDTKGFTHRVRSKGKGDINDRLFKSYKSYRIFGPKHDDEDLQNKRHMKSRLNVKSQQFLEKPKTVENRRKEFPRKAQIVEDQMNQFQKTCEGFGVYPQSIIDFRMQTLRDAKIMRIKQELPDVQDEENQGHNELHDLKSRNMQNYLMTVMSKPTLDKKINLIKNVDYHQRRVRDMSKKSIDTIGR